MVKQLIEIGFDPKALDDLRRTIAEGIKSGRMMFLGDPVKITPIVEPIKITVPIGRSTKNLGSPTQDLFLFYDEDVQEHWVPIESGEARGWRQAFFLPRP